MNKKPYEKPEIEELKSKTKPPCLWQAAPNSMARSSTKIELWI